MECAFFGCYKGRWARTVRALNLGREFTDPFEGIGREGKETGDEVLCLCKPPPPKPRPRILGCLHILVLKIAAPPVDSL